MKRRHGHLALVVGVAIAAVCGVPGRFRRDTARDVGIRVRVQSLSPIRVLDTRSGAGTPVGPASTITLDLSAKVPASTTAVC